jgi:hypothetical protein
MSSVLVRRNERREIRHAVRSVASPRGAFLTMCRVVSEKDFKVVSDRAFDLSPQGMLIPTMARVDVGEDVIVSFRATDLGIWFDTDATIARIIHGRRPGDTARCIGVDFKSLSAVHRLILRGHLRRVPPPLPRRAQRIDYAETVRRLLVA